jgi:glycosyltransferase involved in cell wall biosynthesis
MDYAWECVWVDDFSTDSTVDKIRSLCSRDSRNVLVSHAKNFGQSAALATGFRHAGGDIFVTLDGDGQNDPASIPPLIAKLFEEDADMVNGWREKRIDNMVRKISSCIANTYRNILTGEKIRDVGCALRAFKREVVVDMPVFKGMHRFFPTLVRIAGYEKILEVPVNHRSRKRGKTKYGINNRLWVGIVDTFAVCWMRSRMVYPKVAENE